ncbi:hypothetical protein RFI_35118, partial [Reticulomyxa filosa]
KDNDIQIEYSMVKVEPFDKGSAKYTRIIQVNTNAFYAESSRKEDAFLKKKASQHIPIKSNVQRQPKNYSYTDAAKGSNGNEIKNGPQKPKKRTNRKKNKRKNNKDQILQNKKSDADEISLLKIPAITILIQSINPMLMQMEIGNRSRDEINVANTNMQAGP